jgi:4-amino-4-deoxy-L-arabinose transferase-like glycosyltransferase
LRVGVSAYRCFGVRPAPAPIRVRNSCSPRYARQYADTQYDHTQYDHTQYDHTQYDHTPLILTLLRASLRADAAHELSMDSSSEHSGTGLDPSTFPSSIAIPSEIVRDGGTALKPVRPSYTRHGIRNFLKPRLLVVIFSFIVLVYLASAGVPRLFDQIDGQYAGAAREMATRADWLIPTQDGVPRLQKPPLVYWIEIVSLQIFGVNEFAARLPVVLAAVGWFLAAAFLVYRLTGDPERGWHAGIALSTFTGTFFFTHMVMPEPLLALFMVLTMLCLSRALRSGCQRPEVADHQLLGAWLFIALGCLSKGLHALAIPITVGALSALLKPATRPVWRRFFFRPHGWALLLVVLSPWYIYTEWHFPGFMVDQLWNEQVGRVVNHRWPPDSSRVPLMLFLVEHIGLLFPWSLFLPAGLAVWWTSRKKGFRVLPEEFHVFWLWLLVNSVGIIWSSIQDYYLMISWPVFAFLVALAFSDQIKVPRAFFVVPAALGFLLGALLLVAAFLIVPSQFGPGHHAALPTEQTTVLSALRELPPGIWSGLHPLLLAGSVTGLTAGALTAALAWRSRRSWIVPVIGTTMALCFALGARGMALVQDVFSSEQIVPIVQGSAPCTLICECEANDLTSLFFYLDHPIFWVNANPETEFATRVHGVGRSLYLAEYEVKEQWIGSSRVFLVVQVTRLRHWESLLGVNSVQIVGHSGSRLVLSNQAPIADSQ